MRLSLRSKRIMWLTLTALNYISFYKNMVEYFDSPYPANLFLAVVALVTTFTMLLGWIFSAGLKKFWNTDGSRRFN